MAQLFELIGESPAIVTLREQIERLLERQLVARRPPQLLIQGETGTGKGLLARAIHRASTRGQGPFLDLSCSAIPDTLVEAELFGFERSAFTDARRAKPGLFQAANGGTFFLDEIGTLPLAVQSKLLKVLEDYAVRRLGSTRTEPLDVWIVAATNEDLKAASDAGRFRADLYHRLAAVTLVLPPLRSRGHDILLLAQTFLARACAEYGVRTKTLSVDASRRLLDYPWPGNVRELRNLMERVALLSDGSAVTAEVLGLPAAEPPAETRPAGASVADIRDSVERLEREQLVAALRAADGNVSRTALQLGIPRTTLRYRLARLGLSVDDPRVVHRRDYRVHVPSPGVRGPDRADFEAAGRQLSPFVGRARQTSALRDLLTHVEGGSGQVVGLVGEAGVGKSRLLHEFKRTLAGTDVTCLEARCVSHGASIPFLPVCELLRQRFDVAERDTPALTAGKVRRGLGEGVDAERWTPYLLHLLGVPEDAGSVAVLNPEAIKARTLEAVSWVCLESAERRPLVLLVEDLHWVDRASEEFLASIAETLSASAVMLLTSYRPGYRPPWIDRSYATQIVVPRLQRDDGMRIVQTILAREKAPESLAHDLVARAEGNPFFLEELTRSAVELGGSASPVPVPETIQEVIGGRVDRLAPAPRAFLQAASVLGREFPLRLLGALWKGPGNPDRHLATLRRLELLHERKGRAEAIGAFEHALTQEVVYGSLPVDQRQTLHLAAGRLLETVHAGRLGDVADSLAHHYSRSTHPAKAVEYLMRSAERSYRLNALDEALAALQEARGHLRLADASTRDRLAVAVTHRQALPLVLSGRISDALTLLDEHTDILRRLEDPVLTGHHFFWLALCCCVLGDLDRAEEHGRLALDEASRCGDRITMGRAHFVLALRAYSRTDPRAGIEHGERAVGLLEGTEEPAWLALSYYILGSNYVARGELPRALDLERRALAIGERIGDRRAQSYASTVLGMIHAAMGEPEAGIAACNRGLELAPDPLTAAIASGYLGYAHLQHGDASRAIALLENCLDFLGLVQLPAQRAWFRTLLGEACLLGGALDRACAHAMEGLELSNDARYAAGIGYAEWVLAKIAAARGALGEAEQRFRRALDAPQASERGFWRGRELLDVAVVSHAVGELEDAAAHLRSAYDIFRAAQAPRCVERTERLADELGIALHPTAA